MAECVVSISQDRNDGPTGVKGLREFYLIVPILTPKEVTDTATIEMVTVLTSTQNNSSVVPCERRSRKIDRVRTFTTSDSKMTANPPREIE